MELFSGRLKHAMKIANVKAIDLARLIDVDRSTISNYLNVSKSLYLSRFIIFIFYYF